MCRSKLFICQSVVAYIPCTQGWSQDFVNFLAAGCPCPKQFPRLCNYTTKYSRTLTKYWWLCSVFKMVCSNVSLLRNLIQLLTWLTAVKSNSDLCRRCARREGRECQTLSLRRSHRSGRLGEEHLGTKGNGQNLTICVCLAHAIGNLNFNEYWLH